MRNSGGSDSPKGKSWNTARVSGTGKEQSILKEVLIYKQVYPQPILIRAQAEEEKGSESQGERSSEEEKLEEKGKKEEAKDGQGTSGEQENKEVDKVVDKEVEKSKPSGEKRKSCEERGEGSRRSTGTDR